MCPKRPPEVARDGPPVNVGLVVWHVAKRLATNMRLPYTRRLTGLPARDKRGFAPGIW